MKIFIDAFFYCQKQRGCALYFIDNGAIKMANHADRIFACRQQCQPIIQGQVVQSPFSDLAHEGRFSSLAWPGKQLIGDFFEYFEEFSE